MDIRIKPVNIKPVQHEKRSVKHLARPISRRGITNNKHQENFYCQIRVEQETFKGMKEEKYDTLTETKPETVEDTTEQELFKARIERFVEISKHFSSPMKRSASYVCEERLVSYANPFRIEYKRGGITTHRIKFNNLTLEPVFLKLYKLIPDLEQIKFINLSLSRCKRIPPGLSYSLGFIYDDVNEKNSCNAKMIFVASRKTTTPCYQICEIDMCIEPIKRL